MKSIVFSVLFLASFVVFAATEEDIKVNEIEDEPATVEDYQFGPLIGFRKKYIEEEDEVGEVDDADSYDDLPPFPTLPPYVISHIDKYGYRPRSTLNIKQHEVVVPEGMIRIKVNQVPYVNQAQVITPETNQ